MAIRSAVGGGRARLVRQMLTESTVLCLAGGAAGMLVAVAIHRLLPRLLPRDIPRLAEVQLDLRVFLFAFLLAAVTGLATGLLPALRGARASLALPLQGGTAGTSPGRSYRGLPVVAEVALAFVLLAGAGLLLRSARHLAGLPLGYEPDRVLAATIELDPVRYGRAKRGVAVLDELLGRIAAHPGVEAAGVVSFAPFSPGFSLASFGVVGEPPGRTLAVPQMTSPGYLRAMGLRLKRGRWLTPQDIEMGASQASVAVVNETFARQYLPGREVLGRRLAVGSATLEIVGVLADVRLLGLESAAKPELFTSYRQAKAVSGAAPGRLTLAVRTAGDPAALEPYLRALVRELDPDLALGDIESMRAKLAAAVAQPRFYALLLSLFAATALALAAAGLYGVLSYSVARQTRAIGVRRALGAGRRDVLAMVLGRGLALIATGLAIGVAVAAGVTRGLAHLLSGVTARDPLSYLLAALALLGAGLLACYLPARRATLVDPAEALRHDR
jgi:putative ABC transport system permease protein